MARYPDEDRPKANPNSRTLILGIVAGVTFAVLVLVGWLVLRQPQVSNEKLREQEINREIQAANEKHKRDGTLPLGESFLKGAEEAERRERKNPPRPKAEKPEVDDGY